MNYAGADMLIQECKDRLAGQRDENAHLCAELHRNQDRVREMEASLAWAYRKLLPFSFSKMDDALEMDQIKLLLETGSPSGDGVGP
jgi:hypothetical protein